MKVFRNLMVVPMMVSLAGCASIGGGAGPGAASEDGGTSITTNADEARLITSDIDLFWRAYDDATLLDDAVVYQKEYLDQGTVGLREFARFKIGNAANLALKVRRHYPYYASVRANTLAIHSQEKQIRKSFRRLHQLYPEAIFPTVYFLIGAMNSGGISTPRGLMIGVELFSKSPISPLDGLNDWERSVIKPADEIPCVVAHELIHFQQHFENEAKTLLERAIVEGEADFLSELIAGGEINELQHRYGEDHERELWNEFRLEMRNEDYSRWLYNGGALVSTGQPNTRPADLGYFIGYKICQAYYNRAADKMKAIKEMLEIKDFSQFLNESTYGNQFADAGKAAPAPSSITTAAISDTTR